MFRRIRRRLFVPAFDALRSLAVLAAFAGFLAGPAVQAVPTYYWTGDSAGNGANSSGNPALWTSVIGGSNWSVSSTSISDPGQAPPTGDNVVFFFSPETDPFTALGANFSLNSLTISSNATSPLSIASGSGGPYTLTLTGASGITALAGSASVNISANVALGATQTWTENSSASTETLAGTFNPGDVITTVVNGVSVQYTVVTGDTAASVAIAIATAIDANASLAGLVNATANGAIVNVAGYQGITTVTASSTGAETTTTTTGAGVTLSGSLSGSAPLTFQGTGSTQTPSGLFILSGSNSGYTGAVTLLNSGTRLTVNGNGTLSNASSVTLGGGTVFTIDDTGTNSPNRLSAALPVSSNGGTINLLGNTSGASADQIGVLNLNTGNTNVNVIPGFVQTATLTIASLNRLVGAGVNFSPTGTIALTNSTLSNGILGAWATIGNLSNNGNLDFATVSGGVVVPYAAYDTNVNDLMNGNATANIKLSSASGTVVLPGSSTVNTLYMSGTAGVQIAAVGSTANTLTIGAGGIIANGGTANYSLGNGQSEVTNATWIGGPSFSGGTTANTNTENQGGVLAVGAGVSDLVVTVGGTYNSVTGLLNGALQLNVSNILNTTTALGTRTAVTTNGSTTVTLTSGTTAGLFPGIEVTNLVGTGVTAAQYIVNIIDATHFTIGNATSAGAGTSTTATFTGETGLTKDGGGLLDIGDGNANNKTVAYSYAGPVTVNGGILLIANDLNLGVVPASFNPAAIVLNGGELRSTAGLSFNANRGITVGPQGGTISYVGGGTLTLSQKITGPGGITFNADSYNTAGGLTYNISNAAADTYQGPTIIEVKNASNFNITTLNPLPSGTALTLSLAPSSQSGTNGAALPVTGFGTLNLNSTGLTVGSLASAPSVNGANITGNNAAALLTIGGTTANPVTQSAIFNGTITNTANNTLSVIKNGGGSQTFAHANTYNGTTTINAGTLIVTNTSGSGTGTGAVTVNSGGNLSGSGTISGAVTIASGGSLAPAIISGGANTLTLNGGLTLSSGAILNFDLGAVNSGTNPIASPTSDNIYMATGNLTVSSGADTINLTSIGAGLTAGTTYHLIQLAAGTVPVNISATTFTVDGPLKYVYSVVDNTANKSLDLVVSNNPNPALTWVGAPGNGTWNTVATNQPWTFTGGTGSSAYTDGSAVTFDSTPGQSAVVSIPSNVAPASLTFNNNALVNYTFNGAGAITGAIGFANENVGSVTFNNVNTFTGPALIQAGTVIVGATGALADTSFAVSTGATLTANGLLTGTNPSFTNSGAITLNNNPNLVSPSFSGTSTGTLALTGTTSLTVGSFAYTGTTSIGAGSNLLLNLAAPSAPVWGNISGAGTLVLDASATGDWGTLALPTTFTGTLGVIVGHIGVDSAQTALGGATAVIVGTSGTPGVGGQLDLSAVNGTFALPLTLSGSGYGTTGLQAAALLVGSTTATAIVTGLTVDPTLATYTTTTIPGSVTLTGNTTIASSGIGIISGAVTGTGNLVAGASGTTTASESAPGFPILYLSNAANSYSGTTTVAYGILQFTNPGALYNGNAAKWTAANITVNSGATFAINVGGPADFTAAQANSMVSNLYTGTSTGFQPGSSFGVDTSNATAPVTISSPFVNAGIWKAGVGTLNLTATANNYSGPTSVTNGTLILNGSNTGNGVVSVTNAAVGGTTVLSIRNANALGSGTANSGLAPISMNANGTNLSTSILEIGATIGTDPGGNNADFSYQLVNPESNQSLTQIVVQDGQISLGVLDNTNNGVGFAAYNPTGAPRVVALYEDPNETYQGVQGSVNTLAPIEEKYGFGLGGGDHLTLGSPTSNTTLVLLNPIDLNGGTQRRFASIRGVGTVPEGEYAGAIVNSNPTNDNVSFDGNGGLIFDSAATTYVTATLQIDGGAIYVAASDPATTGTPGALGEGTATMQIGTSAAVNPSGGTLIPTTAGAHLGFMTYGPNINAVNGPLESTPVVTTARNITVGGTNVTYASAVLGGATDDYTAMNGNIALNQAATTPTTFTARNGGRVDFNGVISGVGSVLVNNSIVEGDASTAGIALNNNGTIVFNGYNTYTGNTTVTAGKLYINGGNGSTTNNASAVSVGSGATLGGTGTINGAVTISTGGILEAGMAGAGTLTLGSTVTFSGAGSINYYTVSSSLPGAGSTPSLVINGTLATSSTPVTINILGSLSAGDYALLDYTNVSASVFSLATLPSRASGMLQVNPGNPNELDLDISSAGGSLLWTGAKSTTWDTSTTNWVLQTTPGPLTYNDNPGDAVIFDDTADPNTIVTINGADVHPGSVTFNNSSTGSTYTVSGTNAIAGTTGLTLGSNGGTVILLNTNTFTGATVINSGTLQLGNGAAGHDGSISQTASITNNGSLIYDIAGSQTYTGVISGSGSLAVKGAGTLILTNAANNYGGGTTIATGTLQLGLGTVNNDGQIAGNVTDNGTLAFNYFGNVTFANAITGTGGVTKNGQGTLTLSNDGNSFNGPLTINKGTVSVTSFASDNSGSNIGGVGTGLITLNTGGVLELNPGMQSNTFNLANNVALNGGTLYTAGGIEHIATGANQTVNVGANGGTIENEYGGEDLYVDGQLTGSGALAVNGVTGGNTSTIHFTNNTNTYSGTVTVNGTGGAGVALEIDANNALQAATVNVNGTNSFGSTLLFGGSATTPAFAGLSGTGNFGVGGVALTIGGNNSSSSYSGVISGVGSITKAGSGTLTLSGSNSYTGNTYVTSGTLKLATSSTGLTEGLVSTSYTTATLIVPLITPVTSWTSVTIQPTARWGATTTAGTTTTSAYPSWGINTIWGYAGYIDNTSNVPVTYTFGKNFDDGAYLQIDNTVLINDNTYTDLVTNSITLTPGAHTLDLFFAQGTGGVGPTGANYGSFGVGYNTVGNTGTTGTWLQLGAASSNTAFYSLTGNGQVTNSSVILSSNTTLDLSSGGAPATIGSLAGAAGGATGQQVLLGSATLITGNDNTNTTFSGVISGVGGSLDKIGTGTFTLTGSNTYSGGTSVNGGILSVSSTANLGAVTGPVNIGPGTLQYTASVTTPRPVNLTDPSATIDVPSTNSTANVVTLSTGITGSGGLNLISSGGNANQGMLILTGAGAWTGATTVNSGTLDIEPVVGSPNVSSLPNATNLTNNSNLIVNAPNTTPASVSGTGMTAIGSKGALTTANFAQTNVTNNGALSLNGIGTITGTVSGTGTTTIGASGAVTTVNFTQANVTNNGALNITGNGTVGTTTTAGTITGTGALTVGDPSSGLPASFATNSFNQSSVTINPTGTLALHGPNQVASVTSQLNLNGNGTLDLGGNGLVVNYTGGSVLGTIQSEITSGSANFGSGGTAPGITSSTAAANPKLAIGYGEASTIFPSGGTFMGQPISSGATAVLARTTFGGDANLDGTVNFSDFQVLQNHYNQPGNWSQGDFNGDGVVNFSDFQIIQNNYNQTYTTTPSVQVAAKTAGGTGTGGAVAAPAVSTKTASTASLSGTTSGGGASPNLAATVQEILSLNDNGSGVYTPGSFAVYLVDSTADGNGGIVSFEVSLTGAATVGTMVPNQTKAISMNQKGAVFGNYDDGTNSENDTEIGFNASRSATTAGTSTLAALTASQDTTHSISGEVTFVYGFGQMSGNLLSSAPSGSTGEDTSAANTALQTYNGPSTSGGNIFGFVADTGTFTGATPTLMSTNDGVNVWTGDGVTTSEAANIVLVTQNLAPVPEPTAPVLLLLGAVGLGLTRRRRRAVANATWRLASCM